MVVVVVALDEDIDVHVVVVDWWVLSIRVVLNYQVLYHYICVVGGLWLWISYVLGQIGKPLQFVLVLVGYWI